MRSAGSTWRLLPCAAMALAVVACTGVGSKVLPDAAGPVVEASVADGAASLPDVGGPATDGPAGGDGPAADLDRDSTAPGADVVNPFVGVTCATPPPPGAQLAAPLPSYSAGSCPQLVAGSNTLASSGDQRQFLLVLPQSPPPQPGERFPLVFMWHWLKGSAQSFVDKGEVQAATDVQRFIAVVPEDKGALNLLGQAEMPWPFTTLDTDERMQQEFLFFDDMLACVGAQFAVNKECVSSAGVSAGALFSAQLAAARSQHLSSFISLSGGTGGGGGVNDFIRQWSAPPPHRLPALVLWGGPADSCVLLNFQTASQHLEQQLAAGGHFFVECLHNCKHGEPPLAPPAGIAKYTGIWEFAFNHPFWLPAGASPLPGSGALISYISWCAVGAGSATTRVGDCPPPGCPL